MRLIDADIFKNYITYGYLKDADKKRFSINDVIEMIDKQPTVDSVSGDKKMKILKKSNSDIRLVNKTFLLLSQLLMNITLYVLVDVMYLVSM